MQDDVRPALHEFVVKANEPVAQDTYRLLIEAPELARTIAAGQFMNLQVPGDASHILRIPLSFSCADAAAGTVELVYAVVGEGTARLAAMAPGQRSTLTGPSGTGWRVPEQPGRVLLVAGGVGLPPVIAAARMLAAAGVGFDAVVGARDAAHLYERGVDELRGMVPDQLCDCARRVLVTTDDGSAGIRGFVTQAVEPLLAERTYAQLMACGPAPMLRGVAELADAAQLPCQVSLERLMGCGFGACSCCNVELAAGGYALCCQDGPVFDAKEVVL